MIHISLLTAKFAARCCRWDLIIFKLGWWWGISAANAPRSAWHAHSLGTGCGPHAQRPRGPPTNREARAAIAEREPESGRILWRLMEVSELEALASDPGPVRQPSIFRFPSGNWCCCLLVQELLLWCALTTTCRTSMTIGSLLVRSSLLLRAAVDHRVTAHHSSCGPRAISPCRNDVRSAYLRLSDTSRHLDEGAERR